MTTDPQAATEQQRFGPAPARTSMVPADAALRRDDRQACLEKIEHLIGIYRMRYMHYVWRDHLAEAEEMERKINRLLERWQRVRDRDLVAIRR